MRRLVLILLLCLPVWSAAAQEATPQEEEEETRRLIRVWWSDSLYAGEDSESFEVLEDQIEEFNITNDEFQIEFRLKLESGEGSLVSTLIAAQPVAASVIPDVVLIHRENLATAARNGVIKVIDSWAPDALRADLLPGVLQLGQVDGSLYGLPYAISVTHAAQRSQDVDAPQSMWLPVMPKENQVVNDVLLAQYLAAGGRLVDNTGVPTLDQEPMLEVLEMYATYLDEGVLGEDTLTFTTPTEYWSRFIQPDSEIGTAVVTTPLYLNNRAANVELDPVSLPTVDGSNMVILDSWMWALTTEDVEQQRAALAFVEWLMGNEAMADYTSELGVLPARQRALRIWVNEAYAEQVEAWLPGGIVIPIEQRNNSAAEQLQAALLAVVDGQDYEEAVTDALNELSSISTNG